MTKTIIYLTGPQGSGKSKLCRELGIHEVEPPQNPEELVLVDLRALPETIAFCSSVYSPAREESLAKIAESEDCGFFSLRISDLKYGD